MYSLVDAIKRNRNFRQMTESASVITVNYRYKVINREEKALVEAEAHGQVISTIPIVMEEYTLFLASLTLLKEACGLREYLQHKDTLYDLWFQRGNFDAYHFGELPGRFDTTNDLLEFLTIDKQRVVE